MQRNDSSTSTSSRSSTPTRAKLPPRVLQSTGTGASSSRPGTPLRAGSSSGAGASPQVRERLAELRRAKLEKEKEAASQQDASNEQDASNTSSFDNLSVQDYPGSSSRPSSRASSTRSTSATLNNNGMLSPPLHSPAESEVTLGFGMSSLEATIDAAKTSGRLNIASRSLASIPEAVYEHLIPRGSPYHPSNTQPPNKGISSLLQKTLDLSLGPSTPEAEDGTSSSSISSSGPRWWEVADLTVLKASNNELTSLPDLLAGFPALSVLDLHSNLISSPLPASFGTLTDLTVLNLSNNGITEWPIEIMALIHLRELDLSRNKLKELWPRDGIWKDKLKERLKMVNKEKKRQVRRQRTQEGEVEPDTSMESIDSEITAPDQSAGQDFWSTFPSSPTKPCSKAYSRTIDSTDYAAPLPKLLSLNISHNAIPASAFSSEAMDRLPPSLVKVDLAQNGLKGQIPLMRFGELKGLRELDLSGNGLDDNFFSDSPTSLSGSSLFPSLESLDLSRNALDSLEHLEKCLSAPHSRQIEYSGISSSSLKKALSAVPSPQSSRYPLLQINLVENLLREEGTRRKELRRAERTESELRTPPASASGQDTDRLDLQVRGQELLGILDAFRQNLGRQLESGDIDDASLAELARLVEPLRSFPSSGNRNNSSSRFPMSIPAGMSTPRQSSGTSGLPSRLATEDRDASNTSWSARRKKIQEASQGWAPL